MVFGKQSLKIRKSDNGDGSLAQVYDVTRVRELSRRSGVWAEFGTLISEVWTFCFLSFCNSTSLFFSYQECCS